MNTKQTKQFLKNIEYSTLFDSNHDEYHSTFNKIPELKENFDDYYFLESCISQGVVKMSILNMNLHEPFKKYASSWNSFLNTLVISVPLITSIIFCIIGYINGRYIYFALPFLVYVFFLFSGFFTSIKVNSFFLILGIAGQVFIGGVASFFLLFALCVLTAAISREIKRTVLVNVYLFSEALFCFNFWNRSFYLWNVEEQRKIFSK